MNRITGTHSFQAALAAARRAQLDAGVAAALAQAGEAYGGVLLDGAPYGWVEGPREDTRRWAVDALARLAELRQAADDLPGAVDALEQAIAADAGAEELYRRLMRLQADLGRPDAVRRTYRLLARRLTELDVDPDPATEQLVADLLRRPGASPGLRLRRLAHQAAYGSLAGDWHRVGASHVGSCRHRLA